MNLESCLARTSVTDLRAIASYQQIEINPKTSQTGIQKILLEQMSDPDWIADAFLRLNDIEREILLQVHTEGGTLSGEILQRIWGGDDTDAGSRWVWGRKIATGLPSLRMTGLLFFIRYAADGHNRYIIPDQILRHIGPVPPEPLLTVESTPPYRCKGFGITILTDLFKLLKYLERYRVRPLKDGSFPQKHKKSIIELLKETNHQLPDIIWPAYFEFIYKISFQSGVLTIFEQKLKPCEGLKKWVQGRPGSQIAELFFSWLDTKTYDDFRQVPGLTILSAGLRNPPRIVRKIVLQAIKQFPVNQWINIDAISRYLNKERNRFFRPIPNDMHWRIEKKHAAADSYPVNWAHLEMELIRFIVQGPLMWLNAVTLGLNKHQEPAAFMITDYGIALLSGIWPEGEPEHDNELDRVVVQPDFELLLPDNVVLSVRYKVEKMAQLVSTGPVNRYRLTQGSIIRARGMGYSRDDIFRFLKEISSTPLPQNVAASVDYWIEAFGNITIEPSYILKTRDAYLMKELLSRPAVKRCTSKILGPCVVKITPSNLQRLLTELKKAEYFPWVSPRLMLFEEVAPVSLNLSRDKADLLLRYLTKATQRELIGLGEGHHSALDSIYRQLKQAISRFDSGFNNTEPGG